MTVFAPAATPSYAAAVLRGVGVALALLWMVCAKLAVAQVPGAVPNIEASLVAEGAAVPGEELTLAIRFVPKSPQWHGYWSNPGDAGFETRLDWNVPAGWQVGTPAYPVPTRLIIGGLMNHVYEGEYAVLVPISVPANARVGSTVPIAVDAIWLACTDEICVPEEGRLTTTVQVAADGGAPDPRFATWRAAIAPMLDTVARYDVIGRPAADRDRSAGLRRAGRSPRLHREHRSGRLRSAAGSAPRRRYAGCRTDLARRRCDARPDRGHSVVQQRERRGISGRSGAVPSGGAIVGGAGDDLPPLWLLLAGALAGGLILNVMPCVFPILSLKAISLARAGTDPATARRDGFAYTAGVVVSCVALGGLLLVLRAGGEQVGWAFQLQEPGFVAALLVLAAVITANFAGLFELPSLPITRSGRPAGAFATGVLAAFAATPCTGPFMAAALGAALLLPPAQALLLFATLGVGLALPFLLIGLVPGLRRILPKPGEWMETFRRAMAVPMGLTAAALVWLVWRLGGVPFALAAVVAALGAIVLFVAIGKRQRIGKGVALPLTIGLIAIAGVSAAILPRLIDTSARAGEAGLLDAQPFSQAALTAARADGKPVFVWFTADWCLTCKVNENVAIERERTRAAFAAAGVVALRGDWTRRDPAITQFLTEQGAAGVPLYLYYPAGEEARTLPQILTIDTLVDLTKE